MRTIAKALSSRNGGGALRAGALLVALALAAAPLAAQRQAQPRSGSSSSDRGSSSAGSRHASPASPRASAPQSRGSSGPSRSSAARSAVHRDPSVGRSVPHRDPGEPRRHGGRFFYPYHPRYFGFGYYSPFYYSPFYYPYYYGYPYHYGYPYYGPYYGSRWGYGGGYYDRGEAPYDRGDLGAVSLEVKPRSAEVYVDGRYLGTAKGFDGFPSYLWLEPGVYDLELVHDGYSNLRREIEIVPGEVLEFELRLERGVASRPEVRRDRWDDRDRGEDYLGGGRYPPRDWDRGPYERDARGAPGSRDARREPGRLVFDVRPDDASVYLDGRFIGTGSEVSSARTPFVVDPGEHVLQVVHPEHATEEREVSIREAEEILVEISLRAR